MEQPLSIKVRFLLFPQGKEVNLSLSPQDNWKDVKTKLISCWPQRKCFFLFCSHNSFDRNYSSKWTWIFSFPKITNEISKMQIEHAHSQQLQSFEALQRMILQEELDGHEVVWESCLRKQRTLLAQKESRPSSKIWVLKLHAAHFS